MIFFRDIANDLNFKLKHKVAKDIIAMQQDDYNVHGVNKLFEVSSVTAWQLQYTVYI